jgi:hypothetical protein
LVTATDIVVRYNEPVVLNGATLAVAEKDRIALVGRNASSQHAAPTVLGVGFGPRCRPTRGLC